MASECLNFVLNGALKQIPAKEQAKFLKFSKRTRMMQVCFQLATHHICFDNFSAVQLTTEFNHNRSHLNDKLKGWVAAAYNDPDQPLDKARKE